MRALGTIKKDMENYTNEIPGSINIHELEKITLLSIVQAGPLHQVKTLFASKVYGLDSDVERGNHLQLH